MKRFVLTAGAVFVFSLAWNTLVHGMILADANAGLAAVRRAAPDLALGLAITGAIAVLFVGSFAMWARKGGVMSGARHGLFFAILAGVMVDANQYLVYPIPLDVVLTWFVFGVGEFLVAGVLTGWLYPLGDRTAGHDV